MSLPVIQSTSIFNSSTEGFDFSTDHETLTVLPNITISSLTDNGVYSDFANSRLINRGNIISESQITGIYGVFFLPATDNSSVTNLAGALILGYDGADMDGNGSQTFNNFGKVIATFGEGVYFGGSTPSILFNNYGAIVSGNTGVDNNTNNAGGAFHNFGLIYGESYGFYIGTAASQTTVLTNAATGTIKSGGDAIYIGKGMLSFNNAGKVIGDIYDSYNLHDVVINHGVIRGSVYLQGGNDKFIGTGGHSGPIFGGDGNDHLVGGSGKDQLHGGDGNDALSGGPGADKFFFDTDLSASTNVDTITDFTPAQGDRIVLSETYFLNIGALGTLGLGHFHVGAPVNGNAQIDYHPGNGFLTYDQDGNGSTYASIHFATLASHPSLTHFDFIVEA